MDIKFDHPAHITSPLRRPCKVEAVLIKRGKTDPWDIMPAVKYFQDEGQTTVTLSTLNLGWFLVLGPQTKSEHASAGGKVSFDADRYEEEYLTGIYERIKKRPITMGLARTTTAAKPLTTKSALGASEPHAHGVAPLSTGAWLIYEWEAMKPVEQALECQVGAPRVRVGVRVRVRVEQALECQVGLGLGVGVWAASELCAKGPSLGPTEWQ